MRSLQIALLCLLATTALLFGIPPASVQAGPPTKIYTGTLEGFVCPSGSSTWLQLAGPGVGMIVVDFSAVITDRCGCRMKPVDAYKECKKSPPSYEWKPWKGKGFTVEVKATQRVMPNGQGWWVAEEVKVTSNNCFSQ